MYSTRYPGARRATGVLLTAGLFAGTLGGPAAAADYRTARATDAPLAAESGQSSYQGAYRQDEADEYKFADRTSGSRRLTASPPSRITGEPQLFDDFRLEGYFLSESFLSSSGASPSSGAGDLTVSGGPAQGASPSPAGGGPDDLAWSPDCDGDPGTAKPYCQEPTGYYRVEGTIDHGRKEIVVDPGNEAHPKAPQYEYIDVDYAGVVPAREVLVRVADGCGLYADTYTDVDGEYSLVFPSWCGEKDATVTLYSISAPGAGKQVALGVHTDSDEPETMADIVADPSDYTVVSGLVGTFNPEADAEVPSTCADNSCNGGIQMSKTFATGMEGPLFDQGKYAREGEVSRALTIMENTMTALDYYRQLVDPSRLPQINLVLTDGALQGGDNTAFFKKTQSNLIYIPPRMEWSEWAVVHETGHYFDGGILVEDGLLNYGRWGEAMANVRAGLILGTSWMAAAQDLPAENVDVQGNYDSGAGEVLAPDFLPTSGPGQGWIWRILWDLSDGVDPEPFDAGFGDFDQFDGGGASASPLHHLINGVVMQYLPQRDGSVHPDYVDRGQAGPDLVDMLDGFACLYGMDQLNFGVLLHDVMNYDYDFGHCNDLDNEAPAP